MNPKVDAFLKRETSWKREFEALRRILLACGLDEELKWGQPCYGEEGKNIVLMHGFKEYCAVLFPKGALLKDPKKLLVQQTANVQSARQIRFTTLAQVKKHEKALKAYVREAAEIERSGRRVAKKKTADYPVVEELRVRLARDRGFKAAFEALTPGRQRGYLLYFAQAKRPETREARIEKSAVRIRAGLGLLDD